MKKIKKNILVATMCALFMFSISCGGSESEESKKEPKKEVAKKKDYAEALNKANIGSDFKSVNAGMVLVRQREAKLFELLNKRLSEK